MWAPKQEYKSHLLFPVTWWFRRSVMLDSCDPTDCVARPAPLSMGFSRQEYWSGSPFPSPAGSSQPRNRTWVSCIAGGFFTSWATRGAPPPQYSPENGLRTQLASSATLHQGPTCVCILFTEAVTGLYWAARKLVFDFPSWIGHVHTVNILQRLCRKVCVATK